jgi:hypothetical protein
MVIMLKKKKSNKYQLKRISFYPLKPEQVLSAFMKTGDLLCKKQRALSKE